MDQDAYAYLKSTPEATPAYMAAVHDAMRRKKPELAMKFAEQGVENGMAKPVQLAQADTGTMSDGVPASAPPSVRPDKTAPVPTPRPSEAPSPPTSQFPENKSAPDLHPSVTIEFDGKEFKAIENGKVVKNWPAVSGRPGYQGAEHQGEKGKGPLPEGEWVLRQGDLRPKFPPVMGGAPCGFDARSGR